MISQQLNIPESSLFVKRSTPNKIIVDEYKALMV